MDLRLRGGSTGKKNHFKLLVSPFPILHLIPTSARVWSLPTEPHLLFHFLSSHDYNNAVVKNLPANAGDQGSVPGSGRSPGKGNGNPLQCSRLGNPMDKAFEIAAVSNSLPSLLNSDSGPYSQLAEEFTFYFGKKIKTFKEKIAHSHFQTFRK